MNEQLEHPNNQNPDRIAEINTEAATDEAFAQFAPISETLPSAAISHPLKRAGMLAVHGVEQIGGGRMAQHPELVSQRNSERDSLGLPPAHN